MGEVAAFNQKMLNTEKKIAIYGTTPCGRTAKKAIENSGGSVDIFIDRLRGGVKCFEGIPILHFKEIEDIGQYLIINCASSNFWKITDFLFEQGVKKVYHALSLLESIPKEDSELAMHDVRKMYEHFVKEDGNERIYKLAVILTEKCTLRCKYCSLYMPYIARNARNLDITRCDLDVDKLLDAVGMLESLTVMGGEVFVHPNWGDFVTHCCMDDRIKQVVVLTNATIIPKDPKPLQSKKVVLAIDDYGDLSKKQNELIAWAREYGIKYEIVHQEHWHDVSAYEMLEETDKERIEKFDNCQIKGCWNISGGFLYRCPVSYYKMKYMLSKEITESADFIDLISLDAAEIKEQIKRLYRKKYLEACSYCIGTDSRNLISVGEQI